MERMRRILSLAPILLLGAITAGCVALEPVAVSADGRSFVLARSGASFTPWGFNYDHDRDGALLEDYWVDSWAAVEDDFREMRELGANVVRIHLQFGKFMTSPTEPNPVALDRLARLVELAERLELYLDVTGLGCYHRADVPPWYDALDEAERWRAQATFWRAVAARCASSPAIFCYDLMNEPVVPGRQRSDDWLGPAFAGKHFVQRIALAAGDRPRHEIAHVWIATLVAAIREVDREHLITVGLVPWSLDRPGLTSGFVPEHIAGELDFISVHIYPERGKVDEALETLRGFDVGKPIVIEEIFPLRCSIEELAEFIERSREHAAGWIGFYWGATIEECRREGTIAGAITASWLELFRASRPAHRRRRRPGRSRRDSGRRRRSGPPPVDRARRSAAGRPRTRSSVPRR